jgi:polysaccharide export outer membrane protein
MANLRFHRGVIVAVFFLITPAWAAEPSDDYVIGPGDLLKVEVFQVQDYSRTVRVSTSGRVSLPLVGVVEAAGQTAANLETQLAQRLAAEYIQNPFVSVFIEEYASQKVTVEGEVKKPGVFPLKGRTSLLEVLALAEGFIE